MAPAVSHSYDERADVLYVTFGTGEPSLTENVTDFLLVDIGFFSRRITGFRIVGPQKHGVKRVSLHLRKALNEVAAREAEQWQEETNRATKAAFEALARIPQLVVP